MTENYTAEKMVISEGKLQELELLLLVFSPKELKEFYQQHSKEILLTTSVDIERNQALQELLRILSN